MSNPNFQRGAVATPAHKMLAAPPYVPVATVPTEFAIVPTQLSNWGNDQYGDCVTAEEAFAKAAYSIQCNLSEVFISRSDVITWCRQHGVLNGAMLDDVMDKMAEDGLPASGNIYTDGKYHGVDYSNESILQSAIAQGPVKIGIAANGLPGSAGDHNGWYSVSNSYHGRIDHCVSLCGYGSAQWLYEQLNVPLPSGLPGTTNGYLLFTWSTIGFVTHGWIMGCCQEAWVRNPTTVGQSPTPQPQPPTPVQNPVLIGNLRAEQVGLIVAIRGELELNNSTPISAGSYNWIVVPNADGTYGVIDKPVL